MDTYLKIFYASFPVLKTKSRNNRYNWITPGIITSCKRKTEIFLLLRNNYNPTLKQYYKLYCKILCKVIKEAKRMTFDERILKSNNKPKNTWVLIKEILGNQHTSHYTES